MKNTNPIISPKNKSTKIIAVALFILLFAGTFKSHAQYKSFKIHLGLIYPLSSNGRNAPLDTNNLSINLLAGISAEERGPAFAGFSNVVRNNMHGPAFAGFSNHIGKKASGALFAGFLNTYVDGHAAAFAGFSNIALGNVKGAQFSGFVNVAKNVNGVQFAGFSNTAKRLKGSQFAGFINVADQVSQSQFAGFINVAKDVKGSQLAGFINVAKKVKGTQIAGFINIADSSDCPIGLLNFVKNGEKSIGLSIDENETTLLTFRSGGRILYGIMAVGYNFKNTDEVYAAEAGFGAHFLQSNSFRINVELTQSILESFKEGEYFRSSIKLFPEIKLFRHFALFGGPTFNFTSTNTFEGLTLNTNAIKQWQPKHSDYTHMLSFGYNGGLHILF